jgi:2-C-methyl-D-erythritol 4-phosphate cytidylyltransferase
MRTRLRPSSTRCSLPERVMPDQAWPEELSAVSALSDSASSEARRSDRAQPDNTLNVVVILVAAGSGVRLGAAMPKAFASLRGEPLLAHALRGVFGCAEVGHVIIVGPSSHLDQCREVAGNHPRLDVVAGGEDRSASVEAGLAALRHDDGIVLVHDVARCLAPPDLFARVIRAVRDGHPAVVPGLPVTDTVKVVDPGGRVLATPDRESLRGIQTPQGFLRGALEHAHEYARAEVASATDDAGLVEQSGGQVRVVAGDHRALKITSPLDLTLAAALLQEGSYAAG